MLTEKTAWLPGRSFTEWRRRIVLKIVFLSDAFYKAYPNGKYSEIEQKLERPYICVQVEVNGVLWGIPMRSNIPHPHAIWTDEANGCGLDFTKAVAITKPKKYISAVQPHIRETEFRVLKRLKEYEVAQKFKKYIRAYKKAKKTRNIKRNRELVSFSTLQYFEKYI